ncbi:MAG TPA: response regulator [Longimicrobiales bacterium]
MNGRPKHVLLVEDNDDNAFVYLAVLEFSGYVVTRARDGFEAVDLARKVAPDLIVMDIALPKLDGWEATAAIKQNPQLQAIPVIAVTAHAFDADMQRGLALGFQAYLPKPVEPRRVLAEVERLIGPAAITAA